MSASSPAPHATVVARRLHYEQGGHVVLSDVSLAVGPGTCLGVVGPNGVGKSTLLQILAGLLVPTAGDVRVDPPTASVGSLAQEHAHTDHETVSAALNRRAGIAAAEMGLSAAASGLAATEPQAEDRYAAALARYEAASAGDFEARLVSACTQVDLPPDVVQQPVSTLSGGQEARMALAAILLARFDLTLLDEPTNDLDFEGLSRLEDIVARRTGGMVIVSHDRAFLERTVTDVLELDEHSRTGTTYGGGWDALPTWSAPRTSRTPPTTTPSTTRSGPICGVGPSANASGPPPAWPGRRNIPATTTPRSGSSAWSGPRPSPGGLGEPNAPSDALQAVEKPWEGWDLRFTISETARSGDIVVRLEDAVVERGDFTLGPLTLDIAWAERIALVGPNGSGKTTLVETLLGRLPLVGRDAAAGSQRRGGRARPGPSHPRRCPRPRRRLHAATGLPRDQARSQLAKFGLGAEAVGRPSSSLSPGERTRAELAAFAAGRQFPRPRRADEPSGSPGHRAAGVGAAGVRRDAPARFPRPTSPPDGDHHP